MFVVFDDDIWALDDVGLCALEMNFELVIHAHHRRAILLYVPPISVRRIADTMALGPVSRAVLSAINRKAAEYGAAMRHASRVFRLCADDKLPTPYVIEPSGVVNVRLGEFCRRRVANNPSLFVELTQRTILSLATHFLRSPIFRRTRWHFGFPLI
jgi:hypothetical protein